MLLLCRRRQYYKSAINSKSPLGWESRKSSFSVQKKKKKNDGCLHPANRIGSVLEVSILVFCLSSRDSFNISALLLVYKGTSHCNSEAFDPTRMLFNEDNRHSQCADETCTKTCKAIFDCGKTRCEWDLICSLICYFLPWNKYEVAKTSAYSSDFSNMYMQPPHPRKKKQKKKT